jgi:hypothetical protein
MKKAKSELNDWGRPEYKRSDFGKLERGKYAKRVRESTNVVVLEPEVARVFPNDKAVNKALRGLISVDRPQTRRGVKGSPKKTAANRKTRAA